jgi:ribonuclease E
MLIDATHAEETRVVVLDGNRLEDFDVETSAKKQLKGNIYLAKVVRVEPSLQAAFVEYGGGRHGFLAFGEIHPDYYQIPVADRQRLLEMQEAEARAEEEAEDAAAEAAEAERLAQSAADNTPSDDGDELAESTWQAEAAPLAAPVADAGLAEASAEPVPVETAAELAPTEGAADPTPVEAVAEPVPVEAVTGHAPVEAMAEPAPVEATAEPVPVEATAEPVPVEAAAEPAPVEAATDSVPQEAAAEPAQAEAPAADFGTDTVPEMAEPATSDAVIAANLADEAEAAPVHDGEILPPDVAHAMALEIVAELDRDAANEDSSSDDANEERSDSRPPSRFMRSYKIQEVIRRRQILLVQVVKEERGSKGAALTTFISLAGRFSVLMPNSPRGGGISRKITSAADRRRLKEVTTELQIPRGMGLIVRTAGAARPKAEIKRDCEYLLDLWDSIRETTMASSAPALIHEEANLIKRAIRDNYSRDVDEVLVDGEQGWRAARDFMRMLMPAHARKVILWNEPQPLFARQSVEAQLDAMLVPTVQLRSGGYLVINQTEALVAIDVNSGRSTRERGIEETALKTNLEAADEVARQLRLRDLAGLIVIDFIDMESRRNNAAVEKRMKDALKDDRARIQMGSISSFGLMELSRQRLRPSLAETSFTICPHCAGTGHVRTTETAALAVLRQVEEEGAKRRAAAIVVNVAGSVALYILNHKRVRLAEIEARYGMSVAFAADDSLLPPETRIERTRAQLPGDPPPAAIPIPIAAPTPIEDDLAEEAEDEAEEETAEEAEAQEAAAPAGETAEEAETRRRKRRRRRRGGRRDETGATASGDASSGDASYEDPATAEQPDLVLELADRAIPTDAEHATGIADAAPDAAADGGEVPEGADGAEAAGDEDGRARRRGRRGGRRRRREPREGEAAAEEAAGQPASFDTPEPPAPAYAAPVYAGPTPADPFGGHVFDIFDIMDEHEQAAAAPPPAVPQPTPAPVVASVPETVPEPATPIQDSVAAAPTQADLPWGTPEPKPEPVVETAPVAEAVTPEPTVEAAAPEPVAEAAPALANGHATPEPAPEPAAPEPISAPIPPPILVGSGEPAADKKRGWWRR